MSCLHGDCMELSYFEGSECSVVSAQRNTF